MGYWCSWLKPINLTMKTVWGPYMGLSITALWSITLGSLWHVSEPGCGESHLEAENHMSCLLTVRLFSCCWCLGPGWPTWLAISWSVNSPGAHTLHHAEQHRQCCPSALMVPCGTHWNSSALSFWDTRTKQGKTWRTHSKGEQGRASKRLILICPSSASQWLEARMSGIHGGFLGWLFCSRPALRIFISNPGTRGKKIYSSYTNQGTGTFVQELVCVHTHTPLSKEIREKWELSVSIVYYRALL